MTTGTWYHLKASIVGCTITAILKTDAGTATTTATATDSGCLASGQAGLRTHLTSASFRNVQVTAAGSSTAAAYSDAWASGASTGWAAYGGTWSTTGGIERQSAGGTDGPKLLSPPRVTPTRSRAT
ncbi:hypothetical protein [Homoserinibacter gongjuensis]|uniref:Uncharacterized protein n=1 Tax=Homoserinibacter gongjuensis TaxID=1162968 RepID=A0ABQ6JTK4_9MICO|nr:hypothetical protein [Homoserinibacter gongjuensis]GMA90152.1 hypothetical protein GCM10025869_06810 [Homoserinibacter gongjuensis]